MEGWTEGARAVPRGVSAQLPLGQGAQGPGSREGRCWLSGQAPGLCRGPGTSEQAGGTLRASARRRCRLRGVCGISEQGEHTLSLSSFTHRRGARPGLGRVWSVGLGGLGLPPGRGDAGPGRAEGSRPGFCFRSGGGKKRVWPGRCRPGHPAPEPPSHRVGLVPPPLPEAKTVQMLVPSAQGQERQARGLRSANQTPLPGPCAWACIVYPEEQGRLTPGPSYRASPWDPRLGPPASASVLWVTEHPSGTLAFSLERHCGCLLWSSTLLAGRQLASEDSFSRAAPP